MRREQIGKESLNFKQVKDLIYLLNRQTKVTVSEPNSERTTDPLDVISTVVERLMPFGKYYFDAEHETFIDKRCSKEFHYVDMSIGEIAESGNKMPAFYKTTVSYSVNH